MTAARVAIVNLSQLPPSANNLFINAGKVRVKSPRYRDWLELMGWEIAAQKPGKVEGTYALTVWFERAKRKSDLSNRVKALEDLLVKQGVIEDDSLCERLDVRWSRRVTGVRALIATHEGE